VSRWLLDTRNGRLFKWTPFLAAQPHMEEVEPPEQVLPQGDTPAREAGPTPVVVAPAPVVQQEEVAAPPQAAQETPPAAPPTNDPPSNRPGHDAVKVADKLRIEIKRNAGKRHHR
jgi:hypothetical protein